MPSLFELIAGICLAGLIAVLLRMIDLKKAADANQKTLLEIERMKRDNAEIDKLVVLPTGPDLEKYDFRKEEIERRQAELQRNILNQPKLKPAWIILPLVFCLAGVYLLDRFFKKNTAETSAMEQPAAESHVSGAVSLVDFSNQVAQATRQQTEAELSQVNQALSNDLAASQLQLSSNAEQMVQMSNTLAAANTAASDAQASLTNAEEQLANLSARVADLEAQNQALDQQALELTNSIAQLNASLEDTRTSLANDETNNAFLAEALAKQMAQKSELEHKFNDLHALQAQSKKLKTELFVARRLQLSKNDNDGKKGGELLIQHTELSTNAVATNYDLNVEVHSDGQAYLILPSVKTGTNSPP